MINSVAHDLMKALTGQLVSVDGKGEIRTPQRM